MRGETDAEILRQALEGGHSALPALVDRWTPIIQARIVRVLRRRSGVAESRAFQEVEELVQQVFLALFEKEAAALRSWSPDRGLSLDNWVGLIAEQQTLALLRTRKRNPWTEDPTEIQELDDTSFDPDPEQEALGKDLLSRLLDRLQEKLSPLGWQIFCLLYLEEQSVEGTAQNTGLTPTAVYAWRSRLRKLARDIRDAGLLETGLSEAGLSENRVSEIPPPSHSPL